jgi:hypothetical protein
MRIIIESDDNNVGSQVSVSSAAAAARHGIAQEPIDGGQPSAELLHALGAAPAAASAESSTSNVEPLPKRRAGENAGAPPEWLNDAVESGRRRQLQ